MTDPANSTTTYQGRTYTWKDETFDSVTTIIKGGLPKPVITNWKVKLTAEAAVNDRAEWAPMAREEATKWLKKAADRVSEPAAEMGSDIHAWAEAYVLGEAIPEPRRGITKSCDQFKKFLTDWEPKYEATEVTVYNRKLGYAGTLDALMWVAGNLYLVDYKTGKGVYPDVALQLAAYRHAEFMGLPDGSEVPVPEVFGCAVLHIRPDKYEFVPVEAAERQFRAFRSVQHVRWFTEAGDMFLGQPILPGETDPFTEAAA